GGCQLSRARKLSAAGLSKHDPVRPQLCRSPSLALRSRNWVDVYALPRAVDHAAGLQFAPAVGHVERFDDEFGAVVAGQGLAVLSTEVGDSDHWRVILNE
ncbi:hypothetical protein, partial [Streptomyces wuyuanensis]|uniref:hypothetical protein n=1 Tax=Streptomyces wuyuanensis TaxID=1196353 RepID=UPI003D724E64